MSVCPWGVLCDHYSWCIGAYHTGIPQPPLYRDPFLYNIPATSPLTGNTPPKWPTLETCSNLFTLGPTPILPLTSGAEYQRLVQSCSLEDPPLLVLTSGGYCSTYGGRVDGTHPSGNAFLLLLFTADTNVKCHILLVISHPDIKLSESSRWKTFLLCLIDH